MKFFRKTSKGFTLVEIMIVVAIIGILIAIAVPGFVRARTQSRNRACQENLTKIDGAKEQHALENDLAPGAAVAMSDLVTGDPTTSYLKVEPECPESGTYTVGAVGTDPTCSVGGDHALDAI
ncbi:MAG TPA: prepilin-type N-terminal cleavage/methylation domain-containing protein [Candidatus Sumerlaeota bacterium]|nr:MAG: Type II secretion system protein G precursor [candidate division BRC1 bacterium ADurb.BinA292]HOE96384.1 prepilin-type N-terminal cleavage/methylation domain-containing protein [Candidatus Sumerlaeota bacterium]HPK01137.1 prepilin-type N-terminal cleavage/methylation domain-containing protein [Candidatus Sumerlaeota bacterium]